MLKQILAEMQSFDVTSQLNDAMTSFDSMTAFENAGMTVMTDFVQLDHRKLIRLEEEEGVRERRVNRRRLQVRRKLRSYFPETWVWRCFQLGLVFVKEYILIFFVYFKACYF